MFLRIASFSRRVSWLFLVIAWMFLAIVHEFQSAVRMKKQKNIETRFAIQELLPCPGIWQVSFDELHLKNSQLQRAVHHLGVANWEVSEETYELLPGLRMQCGDSSK
jgi:hypothetical protein